MGAENVLSTGSQMLLMLLVWDPHLKTSDAESVLYPYYSTETAVAKVKQELSSSQSNKHLLLTADFLY